MSDKIEEPVRPDGMSDADWAIALAAELNRRQKAAREPKRQPQDTKDDALEQALDRLQNLKPLTTEGIDNRQNDRFRELVSKAGIPARHHKAWRDHGGKFEQQPQWLEKSNKLTSMLDTGFIVGIIGHNGRGKTQMAVNAIITTCRAARHAKFCTAWDFFMDLKATFRPTSKITEEAVIETYLKPSLLVIDEIHERSDSDWENLSLFHTINKRYEELKDTVLIGVFHNKDNPQWAVDDFKKYVGNSIASRLRETGGVINCIWPSFRGD